MEQIGINEVLMLNYFKDGPKKMDDSSQMRTNENMMQLTYGIYDSSKGTKYMGNLLSSLESRGYLEVYDKGVDGVKYTGLTDEGRAVLHFERERHDFRRYDYLNKVAEDDSWKIKPDQ